MAEFERNGPSFFRTKAQEVCPYFSMYPSQNSTLQSFYLNGFVTINKFSVRIWYCVRIYDLSTILCAGLLGPVTTPYATLKSQSEINICFERRMKQRQQVGFRLHFLRYIYLKRWNCAGHNGNYLQKQRLCKANKLDDAHKILHTMSFIPCITIRYQIVWWKDLTYSSFSYLFDKTKQNLSLTIFLCIFSFKLYQIYCLQIVIL